MNFKIIWSDFSETQLDEIYEYYEKKASLKVATKIVTGIIKESEKLIKASFIGQEEELLKDREDNKDHPKEKENIQSKEDQDAPSPLTKATNPHPDPKRK